MAHLRTLRSPALRRGLSFDNKKSSGANAPVSSTANGQNTNPTANFAPANSNFARFDGTIRIDVQYQVNDKQGQVFFDIIYTPETPALWAGKVREATENGDLKFYLPVSSNPRPLLSQRSAR